MKKALAIGTIAFLLFALVSCGGSGDSDSADGSADGAAASREPAVSEDDAKMAFTVGMVTVLSASMAAAFGEGMEGATFDAEKQVLTLEDFDLEVFKGEGVEIPYSSASGTAVSGEESTAVDLTLEGGPVKSISFDLTPEMFQSEEGFAVVLTIDGHEIEVEITPEDLEGE